MSDVRAEFIDAGTWHGDLKKAEALRTAHPDVIGKDIFTAAVLGDEATVRRLLGQDPAAATQTGPPHGGNALVYCCLSKYYRLDPTRTDDFLRTATALMDAGADPNSGFMTTGQHPEWETALYGAAGVAHSEPMTRLLISRGADPNDPDTVYHVGETYDNGALRVLVETGKLTDDSLALMLIRKHDWHDTKGVQYLLEHGAYPNHQRSRGFIPLHHAIARDNAMDKINLLLDYGADPLQNHEGRSAVALAAREGRSDILAELKRRGFSVELTGVDRLIGACAMGDSTAARAIIREQPALLDELKAMGGAVLCKFSGTCNPPGVRALLDAGVPVASVWDTGDGYWGLAPNSTALHSAAWRAAHDVVPVLLERGAPVSVKDGKGRTPLQLAVRACVDTYWTEMAAPDTVRRLLEAGASPDEVPPEPSGYEPVDKLLSKARARG